MVDHEHGSGRSIVGSNGMDLQPDLLVSRKMSSDYVKVEDFERWKKVNDAAIRERMLRSFIAGVLLGICVLVAIIMAGVSLQRSGKNVERIWTTRNKAFNLERKLKESESTFVSKLRDQEAEITKLTNRIQSNEQAPA